MKKTVWIANTKGGVGKTTLAMFLANAYGLSGTPVQMIDCDARRKLASFMADSAIEPISLDIGASADELRQNPSLAVSYWDRLAELVIDSQGVSIVDLGANVDRMVWGWAEKSRVGDLFTDEGVEMDLFVPMTAEPLAVEGGLELLRESARVFPNARRILVLNRNAGSFDSYEGTAVLADLRKMRKDGLQVVVMPKCVSEGWVDFERLKLHFGRVLQMSAADLEKATGMGRLQSRRALGDLAAWVEELYRNFKGLVPEPSAKA
jgi:hypothetical protein